MDNWTSSWPKLPHCPCTPKYMCSDDSLNHSLSGNRWAWQDRTKHKVYQVNDMEQYANIEQNGKITLKAPPNLAIYLRTCCAKYLSGNIYCIHTCFMVHFCFLLYFTMVESMMSPWFRIAFKVYRSMISWWCLNGCSWMKLMFKSYIMF